MFGKLKAKKLSGNTPSAILLSTVSKATSVLGNVKMKGDLRIDGNVVGEIDCDGKIIIGLDANIQGNVRGKSIDLRGRLCGDVYASEVCILRASSTYRGKISTSKIEVEAGADFCGDCRMEDANSGPFADDFSNIA
jgi:cytoskeletal protein CcmA (bactofilin family)